MKKLNSILTTTDYAMFKYINGNRKINAINLKRLVDSMSINYEFTLVIVNEFMEIIDGQHRIEACKQLGLTVRYIVIAGLRLKDVQRYNSNQKVWSKMDYAESFAEAGKKPYIVLLEFLRYNPMFNLGSCENMLTNSFDGANEKAKRLGVGKGRTKSFQNGTLEISMEDKVYGYSIAAMVKEYEPYFNKYNSGQFIKTIISLLRNKKFDNDRMISQIAKNPSAMIQCSTVKQYKQLMQDIYNHGKANFNRVALYV